jgi:hypothetical protein
LKATRDAQDISNQLGTTVSTPGVNVNAQSTDPASRIVALAADIQQAFGEFGSERSFYPAANRIEPALMNALNFANLAGTLASQNQMSGVKTSLQRAIDYLEMADVLMVYGDVANPIDYTQFLVRQHYVDFLGREPDEEGRAYWTHKITDCGADASCIEGRRIDVSAAYFLSIEFKETGYLVYRLYRTSFGRKVLFQEFINDTQEIEKGLIVGQQGWQDVLATNKKAFFHSWVERPDFRSRYDGLRSDQFVDVLFAEMGLVPAPSERDALVADLDAGVSRADVLAKIVENEQFTSQERNPAFVLMQYFGYLRRDPDAGGFNFWLNKLNSFGGDFHRAEMVKAFLSSAEYKDRFTQW